MLQDRGDTAEARRLARLIADGKAQVVARDLALLMFMAARRAKRAGFELDLAKVAAVARTELARLDREGWED